MKRSRFSFILAFLLAMSAGVVLGALWEKLPAAPGNPQPNPEPRGPDWLSSQLHLRPDQKSQVDAIWAEMHKQMGESFGHRRALEKERDDACKSLLSDDQRSAWDKIRADYRSRIDATNPDREKLLRDAQAKTRALLDEDQQKRWDEMIKQTHERHRGPGPGGTGGPPSGFHGSRGMRSSTQNLSSSTTQPSGPGKGQSLQNTDQPRP
jgi:hypothetical protein